MAFFASTRTNILTIYSILELKDVRVMSHLKELTLSHSEFFQVIGRN